ncbi:malto-oligosyltrehalose trehalohydrolase [Kineosporia sp. A_224]|uniref:malto-oligosyltrehalose trehalohydrolase n=1 Tax=Kineosporia sp. A_224 TaxID=1962180 RepID=UPI000B4BFEEB|nr:malto-oligosyltrehalose trehalohydrolase [Kineosporia sp. A_224]
MHLFHVWAPRAESVDLLLVPPGSHAGDAMPAADAAGLRRVPMVPGDNGSWAVEVEEAGHGTDYAYSLDGGPALPDPRSAWQPHGVHGPSRVFDTARHPWSDAAWPGRSAPGALFYELHLGTFTAEGTFDAAVERLDHLVDLGVDVVELMPVAAFPGRHGWGYDGVALYAVHEPYGGPAAFQRFVDACHARGLAVCLDVVYNHLGPSGNYLAQFGPYFTDQHDTPWGDAVNLDDEGRTHVRRFVCDNALRWFEDFHVDCLRLDAVHALVDDSRQHLLAQLSGETADLARRLGRPLGLVAESDLNDPRMVEPVASGGLGMTAQWSDDLHHALHALLTGEQQGYYADFGGADGVAVLARTLTRVFRHAGDFSAFRGTDWGHPVDPARHRGHRFLAYLQNHDQVGNRALGDRVTASLSPGRLAAGAAVVLTSPFTPMLFMGEEWAASTPWQFFTDHDAELGALVSAGRRQEFGAHGWAAGAVPDPQDPATFEASRLDWAEADKDLGARMLRWHHDLVRLRRSEPDLRDDDLAAVLVRTGADWFVVRRGGFDVAVNLAPEAAVLPVGPDAEVVLDWDGDARVAAGGVRLPADGVAVLRRGADDEG